MAARSAPFHLKGSVQWTTISEVLKRMYHCFNARDIDGVLGALSDDVAWANGMDGGHVHGHQGLRGILDAPVGHR